MCVLFLSMRVCIWASFDPVSCNEYDGLTNISSMYIRSNQLLCYVQSFRWNRASC
jgi:hypothetical protein